MAELILQQRFYIAAILLFAIGITTLFLHPNLIKKIIGLNLMDTSVFLFLAAMGYVEGGSAPILEEGMERAVRINPVPGGLVLTGITVSGPDLSAVQEVSQPESGCHSDAFQRRTS